MKKIILGILLVLFTATGAFAEENLVSLVEKQRAELDKQEEIVKKETARLKALKQEINDDIAKYSKLLKEINDSLNKAEAEANKRLKHVAKAYEAMQPVDAASRLSGLDNKTAVKILLKMKSKKAGLVIGMMEPRKATQLTKDIAKMSK